MSNKPENYEEEIIDEATTEESEEETAFKSFVHHQRRAMEELGRAIEALFPDDFKEHTRNAGKAFVDSFRTLIDAAKDDVKKRRSADDAESESQSATKIKVEIE